jgi:hypothetical protein
MNIGEFVSSDSSRTHGAGFRPQPKGRRLAAALFAARSARIHSGSRQCTEKVRARRKRVRSGRSFHGDVMHRDWYSFLRDALRCDGDAQLSIGLNADFERQELRRIEFGAHRLIFSTNMATWRCAERLKCGAIAISADAKRHGAMRDARSQPTRGATAHCSPTRPSATRAASAARGAGVARAACATSVVAGAVSDARFTRRCLHVLEYDRDQRTCIRIDCDERRRCH